MNLYERCLELEPRLRFEMDDLMVTASWPHTQDGTWTFTSLVVFDFSDAVKLLNHILARLDQRANGA